ncbi:MAG: hypothetical protein ACE364_08290 [Chlorobiota bacterium]
MKKLFLLFAFVSLALIGCSDDDSDDNTTGPSDESISFPLAVGNWWTYNEYSYDAETETQGELLSSSKIEIVEKTTFKGKTAYLVETDEDDEFNGSYFSNENNDIWIGGLSFEDDEFGIAPDWMHFYDSDSDTWEVMNVDFTNGDSEEEISIKIIGTGTKMGETSATINGKSYDGIKFRHVLSSSFTFTIFGEKINETTTTTSDYILLDGVGLYKITTVNEDVDEEDPNTVEVLTDFMVN